mmetsp:Transcript_4408/g.7973  ORF Transcript_4408/g.7973 Transcript_4408/m.7973 type:complete len:83 (-) Transcript_4408:657-905(-)
MLYNTCMDSGDHQLGNSQPAKTPEKYPSMNTAQLGHHQQTRSCEAKPIEAVRVLKAQMVWCQSYCCDSHENQPDLLTAQLMY